ncbi:FBP domain-containing protein [Cellulomonas xiejunii]|uniref:FBP domain-containing protein n=1 Tax=Cellulomonas xiejunii TaxID=2968083 RepID=A0ABY5KUH5_9CELL|nr:FBP domain-containing protein [Cellulomonas xiejunii]MCC2316221.1 FBP domain-containing protein [Cellulomonas xiejunii]MCC2322080.1 FBP domain-containing protein [Cellulomonas xiejunii]UUI73368.1 FBP domain-containing protein [Cellulomonas xiejunii]
MLPLTEKQLRTSFVNASRREANDATLPDLSALDWDRLDYLGWRDRRAPLSAYVVLELDAGPTGVLLRAADAPLVRRRTVCAWCEDLVVTDDVTMYVARRGGASGKRGNTIGTLICTDFTCSRNVRRPPTRTEAGSDAEELREQIVARRIAGLRERSARFVEEIRRTR